MSAKIVVSARRRLHRLQARRIGSQYRIARKAIDDFLAG